MSGLDLNLGLEVELKLNGVGVGVGIDVEVGVRDLTLKLELWLELDLRKVEEGMCLMFCKTKIPSLLAFCFLALGLLVCAHYALTLLHLRRHAGFQ